MNSVRCKTSITFAKWTMLFVSVCTVSSWPQSSSPSSPGATTGDTTQSQTANPEFAAARALLQQGKYEDAVAQLSDLAAKKP
jgi:hypothetical protein